MIEEHDMVALTKNLPGTPFVVGDCACIVHIYPNAVAYELEFFAGNGHTIGVHTAEASSVRPLTSRDVKHVRMADLAAA